MLAVPGPTPVMTPVPLFTVATPGESDVQAPPIFPLEVKVVVPPTHIACVPLNAPALGAVVTVTVRVADAFAHPPVPVNV